MDDFNDSLWGDDDIDEALLIEASQQVEAETVSKVNKSHFSIKRLFPENNFPPVYYKDRVNLFLYLRQ